MVSNTNNNQDADPDSQTDADRQEGLEDSPLSDSSYSSALHNPKNIRFNASEGERKIWLLMLMQAIMKNNQEIKLVINTIYLFQLRQYQADKVDFDEEEIRKKIEAFVYNKIRFLKKSKCITTQIPTAYNQNFTDKGTRIIKKLQPDKLQNLLDKLNMA